MKNNKNQNVCERLGVKALPPVAYSKVGIAIESLSLKPLHALRKTPENGTNGWYIWGGEYSEDPDFYSPLHIEHLHTYLPSFMPYINLPTGFRVIIDNNGYEDVWFDEQL